MQWQDEAIFLGSRPIEEKGDICTVFTKQYGLQKGYLYKQKNLQLCSGAMVNCVWTSRISTNLGFFKLEPIESAWSYVVINKNVGLYLLQCLSALLSSLLPVGFIYKVLYDYCLNFLTILKSHELHKDVFLVEYIRLESLILECIGFGFNFSKCPVNPNDAHFTHVSPATGRAASVAAYKIYKDALLPIPPFLLPTNLHKDLKELYNLNSYQELESFQDIIKQDIIDGLNLTGYFLDKRVGEKIQKIWLLRQSLYKFI